MKKRLFLCGVMAGWITYLMRKTERAALPSGESFIYPGTDLKAKPGDLLFTPIGKSESKYVGHVGIVNGENKVVHSVPSGLVTDSLDRYFRKFRSISIYSPKDEKTGEDTAHYLESLVSKYPSAKYRIFTPLERIDHEQYCTKIVWQAYFYGAGVNLGGLSGKARGIHPKILKDKRNLVRKVKHI